MLWFPISVRWSKSNLLDWIFQVRFENKQDIIQGQESVKMTSTIRIYRLVCCSSLSFSGSQSYQASNSFFWLIKEATTWFHFSITLPMRPWNEATISTFPKLMTFCFVCRNIIDCGNARNACLLPFPFNSISRECIYSIYRLLMKRAILNGKINLNIFSPVLMMSPLVSYLFLLLISRRMSICFLIPLTMIRCHW